MKLKRVLTGVIGFPIVAALLIFTNKYIIDVIISIVAIIAMYEFFNAIKKEGNKPIEILGYLSCLPIALMHVISQENIIKLISFYIIMLLAIMFMVVLLSKMKIGIKDIALTFWGMSYIILFLLFIPLLYGTQNGKFLVWYIFIAAWGTDTFAYLVGMKFGKHKFSEISPKKSIEGCIGGIFGAIILMIIYTTFVNKYTGLEINYLYISVVGILLSLFSQVGDFSASAIKRTVDIKDFGNIFPGHGGMLDRMDSIIFVAPFAYFLLTI